VIEALLAHLGLAGAQVRPATPHWAEQLVRFLTHPVMSSLLISMGMGTLCGTLGHWAGNKFVRTIFQNVKVD